MIKRSLTIIIGLPIVLIILIFGNKYIVDAVVAILATIGIHEYMKCVQNKFKPVSWIGYILAASIVFLHVIPNELIIKFAPLGVLAIVALLFMHVVFSDMKISFIDITVTLFGILYVVGFFAFIPAIYGLESDDGFLIGKIYLSFLLLATWGSDIFAYLIGVKFGKHRFSKISPKKSIEGCIAGAVGGIVLVVVACIIFNKAFGLEINYLTITVIATIMTVLSQIGDFSASCIKRFCDIKDFSNLLPGHGGIIDRFDSVIFAAPFAYYLLTFLI